MIKPLRVLILEDNPADAELMQFELEEAGLAFTSKVVMTEEDFAQAIQEFSPDLILSDYDLPKYNGTLALTEVKRRCPETPFILVTGAVSEDRAIEILTQGAKDYVLKSRLQQRLVPAVKRALAEAEEQRARKMAEGDKERLLQELKIHQIELEMQNEELRNARDETDAERARYFDFFDSAPIGYFTLDGDGVILQVNLAGGRMLGVDRSLLIGRQFRNHVANEFSPAINEFFRKTFEGESTNSYEGMRLNGMRGKPSRLVRLQASLSSDKKKCHLVMIEITECERV